MARRGKALSPDFVKRWIEESAAEEGIVLDRRKRKVIDSILLTLPRKPNPTWISTWCNSKVSSILSGFPEYEKEAHLIRLRVRKEILYFMNMEEFNRLADLLPRFKGAKLRPQWIRTESYALYLSVKRACRQADGSIDWEFVFNRLGAKKFSYRRLIKYGRDKKKIIQRLTELLEKENPVIFSPAWVTIYSGSIVKQISDVFKSDWHEVISKLDKKWQNKFTHRQFFTEVKFYKGTAEFRALVKKHRYYLYALYSAPGRTEKKIRNVIVIDFIAAAQKGNKLALHLLLDSLILTVQVDKQFKGWNGFDCVLRDKITSCVFLFDKRKGADFFAYLYKALRFSSLPIQGVNSFSLNDYTRDGKKELSEFVLTSSQLEEVDDFLDNIKLVITAN